MTVTIDIDRSKPNLIAAREALERLHAYIEVRGFDINIAWANSDMETLWVESENPDEVRFPAFDEGAIDNHMGGPDSPLKLATGLTEEEETYYMKLNDEAKLSFESIAYEIERLHPDIFETVAV